jgi:phosphoribosylformylglycinamidine cyclo-ligase
MAATYQDAGVDLVKYADAMQRLPALMRRTFSPRVLPLEGGFAGLFQLDFAGKLFARKYREPVLVAGTDGVGTKLLVARQVGRHDTVGIDLVAMCVNDLLCTGAEPLLFLDYIAMGRDDPERLEQVVRGVSDGCVQADCSLLGGETAIMPDLYSAEDYDLAGFAVGVVEKHAAITGAHVAVDDVVLGVASSGVHSNGFSLVRKILKDAHISYSDVPAELGESVGDALIRPTKIYANVVRQVLGRYRVKQVVHAIAHITGGGLHENLARVLPKHVDVVFDRYNWPIPAVFPWLQKLGSVDADEMDRVFNMGIGMVFVVSGYYAAKIQAVIEESGHECHRIGKVVAGTGHCRWA